MISGATPRTTIGSRFGGIDADAVARAEAALKSLSSQFGAWLHDEIVTLEAARAAVPADRPDEARMNQLYVHAHDLKGLGATYDFPLVGRVAGSLCNLLDGIEPRSRCPLDAVDAHISGIKVIVEKDLRQPDDAVGSALATSLEERVREIAAAARHGENRQPPSG